MMEQKMPGYTKPNNPWAERKHRKQYIPIWFDPQVEPAHVIMSWYIPVVWPEVATPDTAQVKVNAILIGRAKLPKAMFKDDLNAFLKTNEGYEWYLEQIDRGQDMLKERARKCSKCGCTIIPKVQAKKYVAECPQCHRFANFVRM